MSLPSSSRWAKGRNVVFDHVIKRPYCITIIDFGVFVGAIFSSRVSRLQGFRMHTGVSHIDVELSQNEEFQSTPGWEKCWQYVLRRVYPPPLEVDIRFRQEWPPFITKKRYTTCTLQLYTHCTYQRYGKTKRFWYHVINNTRAPD